MKDTGAGCVKVENLSPSASISALIRILIPVCHTQCYLARMALQLKMVTRDMFAV